MTTDTLPGSLPGDQETDTLPVIIPGTFWFCLFLSVAGNVAATWGHPQDAIIGGLFPVLLVLAERVLHAAGRAPWWVRILLAAVAAACMTWSANHLAHLVHGTWMRWLIPVAVDALLLLTGLLIVSHSSRAQEAPEETPPAVALPAPLPAVVQEAPLPEPSWQDAMREMEARAALLPPIPRETATVEETETVTRTTTRRVSSSGDLSELVSRLRAGVDAGETRPTISAAKTYLGVGHAKAKDVVSLLMSQDGGTLELHS